MRKGNFEFEARVHGQPAKEYYHHDETWMEGREGSNFTLRFRNHNHERVLAVITVDGLSVIDGQTGNYDSGGYIVKPFGFIDVPGWRLNTEKIARFFFSKTEASYASLLDDLDSGNRVFNVGTIGCAVFRELVELPPYISYYDAVKGPRKQGPENFKLSGVGTGFGEEATHEVVYASFKKASLHPEVVLIIRYDDRKGLRNRGIVVTIKDEIVTPQAFPGETQFCKPPRGWK